MDVWIDRARAVSALEDELLAVYHQIERAQCLNDEINEGLFVVRPGAGERLLRGYGSACIKAEVVQEALASARGQLDALLSAQ